jgi:hypothetical protein
MWIVDADASCRGSCVLVVKKMAAAKIWREIRTPTSYELLRGEDLRFRGKALPRDISQISSRSCLMPMLLLPHCTMHHGQTKNMDHGH